MKKSFKAQLSIYVIIALLIVGSVILMVTVGVNNNNAPGDTNVAECHSGNDCLKVRTSCCSCDMGGEEVCVAKEKASLYQIDQNECSTDIACIALYSCREESCGCVSGRCAWKEY